MNAAHAFRQGFGPMPPQPNQMPPAQHGTFNAAHDDLSDDDGSGHRVAHTLTACCRCRQRKTRCDPTLPRCLPCERSGSVCEYLDTTKGKKINRFYVIKLQDKVRALEAELAQYTDDDNDYPRTTEDMVRPGGFVRVKANDETSRYLGPSSGIAMTRLLMEEAKKYTDSQRIADLIPAVRAGSHARMQSIQMTGPPTGRKKSYPMMSERAADGLPSRSMMDKLAELFNQKCQLFWPVLHEVDFKQQLEEVYGGDEDPYKNFVLRMVIAISLQKVNMQYAGLADSYYLAAMRYAEAVIRPKDLKTLQCLILIGHYSLLTPTRTPVYYVIGLATRICQQEGLTDEQTITNGYNSDPKAADMRRRLAWIVAMMDFGLSYHMGRPSGFATDNDRLDVSFFATVEDEHVTTSGIEAGPVSERKALAIHFYKSRALQTEIRRMLYEQKRAEPKNDSHPWYASMEKKMEEWFNSSPENPGWSRSWLSGFYHHMRVVLYRPSPQVPQPSAAAAGVCYESSAFVLNLARKQMDSGMFNVTWVFLIMLNSCLNTLLWSTSYEEVRHAHARGEVEDLVELALTCMDKCSERWPGTSYQAQLYSIISKACLQSYERTPDSQRPMFSFASPSSGTEAQPSPEGYLQAGGPGPQQLPYLNPPQFGFVFDSSAESMNAYTFDPNYPPPQPAFRSNSIFCNPATDSNGRRFSYFPPELQTGFGEGSPNDVMAGGPTAPAAAQGQGQGPVQQQGYLGDGSSKQLPTPPDSLTAGAMSTTTPSSTLSPPNMPIQATNLSDVSAAPRVVPIQESLSPPQKYNGTQPLQPQQTPNFTTARPSVPQRPLPVAASNADWFSPAPPFMSAYNFGPMSSNFFNDPMTGVFGDASAAASMGLQGNNIATGIDASGQFTFLPDRQGSLTQSQQAELMNTLETDGVGDIDAFLNASNNMAGGQWY